MIDAALKAVFFDAVGTLITTQVPVGRTYAEFARKHGAEISEDQVRDAFRESFARQEKRDGHDGWRTDENRERYRWRTIVEEIVPANADACFADLWEYFSQPAAWQVHPEASRVLNELDDRGLTVGIASNFDSRLNHVLAGWPDLRVVQPRCVVSSLVGWRKPAKEFFAAVVQTAACSPEEILFVGDDLRNDIHGATAAGLKAVLFDPEGRVEGGQRIRQLRDLLPG